MYMVGVVNNASSKIRRDMYKIMRWLGQQHATTNQIARNKYRINEF